MLRLGTGGFAVGVAAPGLAPPFKSIGNNPLCWVAHSTGQLRHDRRALVDDEEGGSYGVGDTITVVLSTALEVSPQPGKGKKGAAERRSLRFYRRRHGGKGTGSLLLREVRCTLHCTTCLVRCV